MKIDNTRSEELKQKVTEILKNTEDKNEAVYDAIDMIMTAKNQDLVQKIQEEAERAAQDSAYKKALGLRSLSQNEVKFYTMLKEGARNYQQSVTASQIDIIPRETIDWTLNEIKKDSGITRLINFAPANVKKWLTASKTGAAVWGNLTNAITGELEATIVSINMEVNKLTAYCVIPKAIRDLEIGYVDRYFTAILNEAMHDGIVKGYLTGDGKTAPIGIMKTVEGWKTDGTAKDKSVVSTVTGFSPKQLSPILKTLCHNGLRTVDRLFVLCNPLDEYEYVNPSLYGDSLTGGYINKSFLPIEVIADANVPQGKGIFTIQGYYTMGFQGVKVDEYKETKALDDMDVMIAKVYGNGRAADDDTAVVFDITKLQEYVPTVLNKAAA